ncbi:MAG: BACON domain-containing carbohydrate-binding protein [Candidatus Contendobacter sp.]|nr:BACON domain-containing carbohydrate-binding protein [Candidatus Contendobacter sp.]MDG4559539.1 BACON domain-containing carbohydrate-binding protein [Candidatus Contendobacter sp.]
MDANGQSACGLALASGRCVFTCGPGSLRCEGGVDSLPLGQFDLTDLPTEADGTLTLQTFVFGSPPGRQVVRSDGTAQLVGGATSPASSRALNPSVGAVGPGRYRLTGTLVDANGQPACGLALASGRCVFSCGPGSLRCEGGASSLPLGQFELTDLPTEADGTLTLQTFVFGSLPGRQSQATDGGGGGGCSQAITPTSQTFEYLGGAGTVTVSAPAGCAWTAQSHNSDWLTITAGTSGTGPGTTTYTVTANASGAKRTGILTIAGQTHTVTQNPKGPDPID